MKKLTALLLSVVLVLGLAACGSANKPASSTTQPETSAPTEQPATEPSESSSTAPAESEPETQPETGKTLVVYYSASGNTERVAKDIAEAAGADLFEIVPTEVYTSEDPFYRQFQQQYDVISGMGISTGRIVLNGWPHGFGSDGGWVKNYAAWLKTIFT